jgi:group II intron reverse transcriptase/maturase
MRSPTVSTRLQQLAQQAVHHPDRVFATLAHLVDVDLLREAYCRTADRSPGIDRVTKQAYGRDLETNLADLHARLRTGRYHAPPVERVWLEKEDGGQRPIGKPTFEDKVAQRAYAMVLSAVYERDFLPCSYGFREGRSPHHALHAFREGALRTNTRWVVDADIKGFFDSIPHGQLREVLQKRVNDGGIIRQVGKWLNAGVLEAGTLWYPEGGTPQGGVISPLLANVYLHEVLDVWFEHEIRPRLKGQAFLVRFADDFVIGCELEHDALRILDVLPKRFARYGLTIHPEKTKLVPFGKPTLTWTHRNGTFDFLGFTHYWGKTRKGTGTIKRKTKRKKAQRTIKHLWTWCRSHRHLPLSEQHGILCAKLRGHIQYYGIRGNIQSLRAVVYHTQRAWRYWLHRRSSKKAMPWDRFANLLLSYPLPKPRIVHPI